jgi:hypothetical protein
MLLLQQLPLWLRQRLEKRHALLIDSNHASEELLSDTLHSHDYQSNDFVQQFEKAYGGLEMPELGSDSNSRSDSWLFGAYNCLLSQAHVQPRGDVPEAHLVPVVYSPNDIIYFLDPMGRAYAQDTIEEPQATLFAANALAMVCRILLWDEIFYLQSLDLCLEFDGLYGRQLADLCGLQPFQEASADDFAFWGDAQVLVVETPPRAEAKANTRLVSSTKKRLNAIKKLKPRFGQTR